MKISKYFLIALASLGLFACSNDNETEIVDNGPKSISVTLAGATPKATGPTEIITADTKDVNSVLINLTDASGTVIATKSVTKSTDTDSDWDKLVTPSKGLKFINVPQAVSKVYVYGNPGSAVTNNVVNTTLADQQGSAVLYYGMDDDLTPVVPEPVNPDPTGGNTYTANVSIAPIVARIQIKSVSFKNTGSFVFTREINGANRSANVTWDGFTANLKGIYLNAFYNTYNLPGTLDNLLRNTTFENHIQNGEWLFDTPATNASEYASYSNYTGGAYANLPLAPANQAYAFNFFPGTEVPTLHLDLANIDITNLQSSDVEVFNPALAGSERFSNIIKYYRNTNEEMTAADFKPGTLYNMDIEVIPLLDNDLGNIQYNVLVHVTIEPWAEETIIPGFDLEQ
ncbi:hypothetical protein [Prevotella sp. 10(H)]|uniref:hypothetical protein n=1 Tax=Prevotella sp. 10(H) TaxID=1158294 RepID=UPI0004A71C93|nr:hypothetical protein [Prevotella sp. 10(H)]